MTVKRKAIAAAISPDRKLFEIETKARVIETRMCAAEKKLDSADRAFRAWQDRNPQPKVRRAYPYPADNPDLKAAKHEHAIALAQWGLSRAESASPLRKM
jgi:hypothetical protein